MMKMKYMKPRTESISLVAMGYICAGDANTVLGGSKTTDTGFGDTGDEAKQFTPIENTDWPSYNLWED